jgi:hypothetical protein
MSKIILDKNVLLPKVEIFAKEKNSKSARHQVDLSDKVIDIAQEWVDVAPWKYHPSKHNTKSKMKSQLKSYVNGGIDSNHFRPKFIPVIVWWWLATQVIGYVIKLIIEYIWNSIQDDF